MPEKFTKLLLALLLFHTYSQANATDASSLFEGVNDDFEVRAVSHVTLLSDEDVKNYKIFISGFTDHHLEEFRKLTAEENDKLIRAQRESMEARNNNLIWWSKFHEWSSGKLIAGGYIVMGASAVVLIASTFFSPGCGNINYIQLGAMLGAGSGRFFKWLGDKSTIASKKCDAIINDEVGKNQHLVSILDDETQKRDRASGLVRLHDRFRHPQKAAFRVSGERGIRKRKTSLKEGNERDIEMGLTESPREIAQAEQLLQDDQARERNDEEEEEEMKVVVVTADGDKGKNDAGD